MLPDLESPNSTLSFPYLIFDVSKMISAVVPLKRPAAGRFLAACLYSY